MSSRTLNRSTTTSIVCLRRRSSFGGSSSSQTSPSMRARTKPRARRSAMSCVCSPLRSCDHRGEQHQARARRQRQHLVHHLAHGLGREVEAVIRAARGAGPREQQPQVVVDLRHRADGRARIVGRGFLLDGDRRRQPLDVVHVGLFHHGQELARVGRERLHVAPLALGVDRVEGERGLAGAGQAGDDDQPVPGQVEVDVLEIVGARAADADESGPCPGPPGKPITIGCAVGPAKTALPAKSRRARADQCKPPVRPNPGQALGYRGGFSGGGP